MVGINFLEPQQTKARVNYMIFMIMDLFSKWTEAYALLDKCGSLVALALVNLFCNKCIPQAVLLHNASKFCKELIKLQINVMRRYTTLKCSNKREIYKKVFNRILSTILHKIKVGTILTRQKFKRSLINGKETF